MPSRLHLKISGFVQGVLFRHHTQRVAKSLTLTGWVRNTENGYVEIMAEGQKEKLEELLAWAKVGPPGAFVKTFEIKWEEYQGEFEGFEIRY